VVVWFEQSLILMMHALYRLEDDDFRTAWGDRPNRSGSVLSIYLVSALYLSPPYFLLSLAKFRRACGVLSPDPVLLDNTPSLFESLSLLQVSCLMN
jgi:hypothetical protein